MRGREFRNFDFALLALTVASLSSGERFVLNYPVTRDARDQFGRYSRLLRLMAPDQFSAAEVACPIVIEAEKSDSREGALCLSGGVDAIYSGLSRQGTWTHGLLVRGADYALTEVAGFNELSKRVAGIASHLGLQTIIMETNLREVMSSYKLQHAGLLASCLHCLGACGFGHGAYSADYATWQELVAFPWGSLSGIADTLTTGSFPIVYPGDGIGRSEKVRRIATRDANLFSSMSVCWSDTTQGGNCGHCSKCMRTRLNLHAIGDDDLRRESELMLFGDHKDPVDYVKAYEIDGKPKNIQREIGWFDDIMLALPDGDLRSAVETLLVDMMNAHGRQKPGPKRALIPRLFSRIRNSKPREGRIID